MFATLIHCGFFLRFFVVELRINPTKSHFFRFDTSFITLDVVHYRQITSFYVRGCKTVLIHHSCSPSHALIASRDMTHCLRYSITHHSILQTYQHAYIFIDKNTR